MSTVSKHARKRGHERLGLDWRAMERTADKALRDGLKIEDMHGKLRRWADHKRHLHPGCNVVLYGTQVFVFGERDVLVTCNCVSPEVRRSAAGQWMMRRQLLDMAEAARRSGEVRCG